MKESALSEGHDRTARARNLSTSTRRFLKGLNRVSFAVVLRTSEVHIPIQPMMPQTAALHEIVADGLAEDVGTIGDVTTLATIGPGLSCHAILLAKSAGVVAGFDAFRMAIQQVGSAVVAALALVG